jgi:chromosome partitioning protein
LDLGTIQRPAAHLRGLAVVSETLCIIDTPPTLGRRLLVALIAADAVVSPLALNGYSIQGITDPQKTIQMVRARFNPRLKNLGLLANMANSPFHDPRPDARGATHGARRQAVTFHPRAPGRDLGRHR